jgi:hypothetical protein
MRKIALGVLVLISLAMLPSSAANAPKAGASCKKIGTTTTVNGKKFTCVKSGKKLIWNKGVKVSVPRPSATPTPAASPTPTVTATPTPPVTPTPTPEAKPFIPWSVDVTAKQVSDAAQKSFRDWAAAQAGKPVDHQFFIQDGVFPNRAKSLAAADKTGTQLFSQFFSTKSITVIGRTEEWVVQKLNSLGGNFNSCSINYVPGLDYCWDAQSLQGMVVLTDMAFNPSNLGIDGSSLLAHEYFHLIQYQLSNSARKHTIRDGSAATAHLFPAWFAEGTAEFAGFSIATLAMDSEYWQGRELMNTYGIGDPAANRNALVDAEIRTYTGTQPNGPVNPYMIGRTATEYLVASAGFQAMLDIWLTFKETKNFEKSFEKAIGITKDEFYEKFEKVRTKLDMPEVSWKLVCTTNTPLRDVPTVLPKCDIKSTLPGGFSG